MDNLSYSIQDIVNEINYYFSLLHGGKLRPDQTEIWFPLDKMMESIYFSNGIGEAYGLDIGYRLLCQCYDLFNEHCSILNSLQDVILELDGKTFSKIGEIWNDLKLRIEEYVGFDTIPEKIDCNQDVLDTLEGILRLVCNHLIKDEDVLEIVVAKIVELERLFRSDDTFNKTLIANNLTELKNFIDSIGDIMNTDYKSLIINAINDIRNFVLR